MWEYGGSLVMWAVLPYQGPGTGKWGLSGSAAAVREDVPRDVAVPMRHHLAHQPIRGLGSVRLVRTAGEVDHTQPEPSPEYLQARLSDEPKAGGQTK
ncbi:hypothetical protein GCM10010140_44040 [Streptosporangium pseudovulgare]|uniref:Uncharacterized protein n=1 Tax=Streptosporangium pseudovulgare TaxID=35765 RepID=A0ABQ2R3L2_9ACTN|nr:hypothetical protein GCM10010140_44040 [Streptosporangium pseudovulgare]